MAAPPSLFETCNLNNEEFEKEKLVEEKIPILPKGNLNNEELKKEESVKKNITSLAKGDHNHEELEKEKSGEEKISSLPTGNLNNEELEKEKSVDERISSLPKGDLDAKEQEKEKSVEEKISSLPKGNFKNEELEKEKSIEDNISSLTKAKGWITHYLYRYQGFWYDHLAADGTIFAQQNYNAKSTDILLATNMKCGTTWLKSLTFAIKNRAAQPPQNDETPTQTQNLLLIANPHTLISYLELGFFDRNSMEEVEALPSPRVVATHIPYCSLPKSVYSSGCRVVYMCREPKDVFVSMWHFFDRAPQKEVAIIPFEEAFDMFCQGFSLFGPYWDHVVGYYKASLEFPQQFLFLKYEEMHRDTLNEVKKLAKFLGYPFSLEEEAKGVVEEIIQLCSFENMRNLEVNKKGTSLGIFNNERYFRKGKVGDSKNYLTPAMVERLDVITKEKFQGLQLGY